jgi:hypothetical protein
VPFGVGGGRMPAPKSKTPYGVIGAPFWAACAVPVPA